MERDIELSVIDPHRAKDSQGNKLDPLPVTRDKCQTSPNQRYQSFVIETGFGCLENRYRAHVERGFIRLYVEKRCIEAAQPVHIDPLTKPLTSPLTSPFGNPVDHIPLLSHDQATWGLGNTGFVSFMTYFGGETSPWLEPSDGRRSRPRRKNKNPAGHCPTRIGTCCRRFRRRPQREHDQRDGIRIHNHRNFSKPI